MFSMTKKIDQFLRHWKIGKRKLWFNISPSPSSNRYSSRGWAGRVTGLCLCFGVWSACKITCIQFQRIFIELNFWNFLLVVVRIHHKLIWSMRKSNPRVSIVSVRGKILISTPCLPCKQLVVTSSTGPIFVFPWIHPLGCDDPSSLGRVYSRQANGLTCVKSPASFVMKYCPISTTFRNSASILNLLNLSCCVRLFNSFSIFLQQKVLICLIITILKNFCLDRTENDWLTHYHIRSLRSFVKGFTLFAYFCDCSAETELDGRNNYAKNSLNCFMSGTKMNRQISMSFAFEIYL